MSDVEFTTPEIGIGTGTLFVLFVVAFRVSFQV
jgi:hypothetical protein